MWMQRSSSMQSSLFQAGNVFQLEILGRCGARCTAYRNWRDALAEAKRTQPVRKTEFLQQVEQSMRRILQEPQINLFTAVGSAFDIYHGVDAFVEYKGTIVTIDVTRETAKTAAKADVVYQCGDSISNLAATLVNEILRKRWIKAGCPSDPLP
jgi:hypothetical protein